MLVILHGAPGAAPGEAVLEEEPMAEVAFLDLVAILFLAVGIGLGCGGLDDLRAVLGVADVGII